MEIGDRAWDVGKAAVHAANFGISEAGKALRNSRNEYYNAQQEAQKTGPQNAGGMPQWARQIFGLKGEQTPVDLLRTDGKKRQNGGAALLAVGITFMVIFGLGTLGCLIGLGVVSPAALGDVVMTATEDGSVLMTGTDYVMNTAYNALGIVAACWPYHGGFGWTDGLRFRLGESRKAAGAVRRSCGYHRLPQGPFGPDAGRPRPPEPEKNAEEAAKIHPQRLAERMAG